ncbi:hypothetical protein [Burkholderia sp. F1]|uniref:hypothetical protein n=1 Tax=Burkholderia sp. F1 TaxID=3366817 RepID=UPI003D72533B
MPNFSTFEPDYFLGQRHSHHQQHTLQTPTGPAPMVTDGVPIDIQGSSRRVPVSERRAFSPVGPASSTVPVVFPVLPPNRSLVVLSLHVRLSSGVEFDLGEAIVDDLPTVIQMFGRLTCFGSTKGLKAYRKRSDNNTTQLLGIVRTHAPSDGLAPL